jgi:fucose permease
MAQSIKLQAAICALAFILQGVAGALLGATLPDVSQALHIQLDTAGVLFTIQLSGSLVSVLFTGRLLDVIGQKIALIGGALLLALGLALLPFCNNLAWAGLAVFIFGTGFGILALTPNVIIVGLYRERSGTALNILNVFYGLGAAVGPVVTGLSITQLGNFRYAYWLMAGLSLSFCVVLLFVHFPALTQRPGPRASVPWSGLLLLLAGYFFLDVGFEISFSGWIFTYLRQRPVLSVVTASLALSVYWLAMISARLLGAWLLRWLSEVHLLSICAVGAGAGICFLLLAGEGVALNLVAVALVGLGIGPLFPTGLSIGNKAYPEAMGTISGTLLAVGIFGGMTVPWLQGQVAGMAGPAWGMSLLLLLTLLMLPVMGTIGFRYQPEGYLEAKVA